LHILNLKTDLLASTEVPRGGNGKLAAANNTTT
jgi:hypothetical protein